MTTVCNIAKGRVAELYDRVKAGDPAGCALILVPLQASGIETDAVLQDKVSLADVLAGSTDEQTTMGRKILVAADLAAGAPDQANDRNERSLPTVTWAAASGNAVAKLAVCYRPAVGSADTAIVPLTIMDWVVMPSGSDQQMTGGAFFRAA